MSSLGCSVIKKAGVLLPGTRRAPTCAAFALVFFSARSFFEFMPSGTMGVSTARVLYLVTHHCSHEWYISFHPPLVGRMLALVLVFRRRVSPASHDKNRARCLPPLLRASVCSSRRTSLSDTSHPSTAHPHPFNLNAQGGKAGLQPRPAFWHWFGPLRRSVSDQFQTGGRASKSNTSEARFRSWFTQRRGDLICVQLHVGGQASACARCLIRETAHSETKVRQTTQLTLSFPFPFITILVVVTHLCSSISPHT